MSRFPFIVDRTPVRELATLAQRAGTAQGSQRRQDSRSQLLRDLLAIRQDQRSDRALEADIENARLDREARDRAFETGLEHREQDIERADRIRLEDRDDRLARDEIARVLDERRVKVSERNVDLRERELDERGSFALSEAENRLQTQRVEQSVYETQNLPVLQARISTPEFQQLPPQITAQLYAAARVSKPSEFKTIMEGVAQGGSVAALALEEAQEAVNEAATNQFRFNAAVARGQIEQIEKEIARAAAAEAEGLGDPDKGEGLGDPDKGEAWVEKQKGALQRLQRYQRRQETLGALVRKPYYPPTAVETDAFMGLTDQFGSLYTQVLSLARDQIADRDGVSPDRVLPTDPRMEIEMALILVQLGYQDYTPEQIEQMKQMDQQIRREQFEAPAPLPSLSP